jgi:hypothetical protein
MNINAGAALKSTLHLEAAGEGVLEPRLTQL